MAGPVLACIDGSEHAREAARVAQALAARLDLDLALVHVAPPLTEPGVSAAPAGQARLAEEERRDAEELLERVAHELGVPPEVERHVLIGDAARALLEFSEEQRAGMIVLGSRGHGRIKAALLGSVSAAIVANARCIVVVVPPGAAVPAQLA
jgi:nucleotide-binding universal stress UspA family protein